MKIKMMTAIGLVALGIGQIKAQENAVMHAHTPEGEWHAEFQESEIDKIREWIWRDTPIGTALAETRIRFWEIRGKRRFFECKNGETVPNCDSQLPPDRITSCGLWRPHTIYRAYAGSECPPIDPTSYTYWLEQRDGSFALVYLWTITWRGNCLNGYSATQNVFSIIDSPDCAQDDRSNEN